MKFLRTVVGIFIFTIGAILIFVIWLDLNIVRHGAYEEHTIARLFSRENIIETVIGVAVIAAIILPIRWAIMKRIEKNQKE